jgi:hypothetical protein
MGRRQIAGAGRGKMFRVVRRTLVLFTPSPDARIKVLVAGNPRRVGSAGYRNFALYEDGLTVAELKRRGGQLRYLRTDLERGHVALSPA